MRTLEQCPLTDDELDQALSRMKVIAEAPVILKPRGCAYRHALVDAAGLYDLPGVGVTLSVTGSQALGCYAYLMER